MKLTKEQKLKLGLEAQEAEDVPDEILIPAIERISTLAAAGQALTDQARAECLRVARLAEVGAEGELPAPITTLINRASAEELQGLTAMYTERAAAKFPHTCSHCGTKSQGSRSSVETPLQDAPVAKPVKIGNALH